jgi:hypothetical protein
MMQISLKQREALVLDKCLASHRRVCAAELKLLLLPEPIRSDVEREAAITEVLQLKLHLSMKKKPRKVPCAPPVGSVAMSKTRPGLPCMPEAGKLPAEGR